MDNEINIILYSSKKNKLSLRNTPYSNKFQLTLWERKNDNAWNGKGIEIDSKELAAIQSSILKFHDLATRISLSGRKGQLIN